MIHRLIGIVLILLLAPAARAATELDPPFEIPRLGHISIDGKPDDWGDRGFRVDIMADTASQRPVGFESAFRLGWDEQGLLVLATVTDPTPFEAADKQLDSGDCVSVMLADNGDPAQGVEVEAAPGRTVEHPQARQWFVDRRAPAATRPAPLSAETACTRTAEGYVVEMRVPWSDLGIHATPGIDVAVQVCVTDGTSPASRFRAVWFPAPDASSPGNTFPVRLSDRAGLPIEAAAYAEYQRFRRARVYVNATTEPSPGGGCTITAPQLAPVSADFSRIGQHQGVQAWLPLPPPGQAYPLIRVQVGKFVLPTLHLPDPQPGRHREFLQQAVVFHPPVFSGTAFPQCEFENPDAVDDLIGPYTLTPTFYDAGYHVVTTAAKPGRYGAIIDVRTDDGQSYKRFASLFRTAGDVKWRALSDGDFTASLSPEVGINPGVAAEQARRLDHFAAGAFVDRMMHDSDSADMLGWLYESQPGAPHGVDDHAAAAKWWYGLLKLTHNINTRYLTYLPPRYGNGKKWPLIVFLHGSGERGDDLELVRTQGLPLWLKTHNIPFIVVSPQALPLTDWNPWEINALIDQVRQKYRVDDDRIYLTGLSMGGFGTWATAEEFPGRFAAIVPISGAANPAGVARLKNVPVWAFHGAQDPVVPVDRDIEGVRALEKAGGDVTLTIYPDGQHDVWTRTYADPKLYDWMLSHRRGQPATRQETLNAETRP